jgi:ribulose-5-phosphate 4-epimerase/fuculose-1-phosphate aldolase
VIRGKLAQAYQILAYLGLDDLTYTHLSARSKTGNNFYIYPFGMLFEHVTPDVLLDVPLWGEADESDRTNPTGYTIHKHIYQKRPDIQAIFHIHVPEIVAVSACKAGLLPISQWALHFYNQIAYHDYDSLALHGSQGHKIADDLQDKFTLLMRNHGSVTCGRTIEEAMFYTYHLYQACKTQCLTLSMNLPLELPSDSMCQKANHDLLSFEENLGFRDWAGWVQRIKKHAES